ncbi:MAG: ATP-binding protein [Pseudomonadota bacterium]|nr:ATP-binding protein [Pseudomonadota bacterium]
MRIRSLLLLLAAIVLIPSVVAAAFAVAEVRKNEREASLRALRETVRATSLLVDGQVRQSLGAMGALANSPSLQSNDLAAFYKEAKAIDPSPDVWTLLIDESGVQRVNTAVPFGTPPPPPVAKERVAQALALQGPFVTDLLVGPVTGKLLTSTFLPARPTPQGRFVVARAFSVEHWKSAAMQPQEHPDWVVGVIDRSGRFIARSQRSAEMLGRTARPELVEAAAAADSGLIRHNTHEGIESYDAFVHSALTGWTVAVAAPVQSIEASATQAITWLVAGLAIALAVALAGASLLSRALLQAIDSASQAARALGAGHQPESLPTRVREVDALNQALAEAGQLLSSERRARSLAESEREALLDNERQARLAAQGENAAKDQFLALLGHELRNPLAAIGGAAELLARNGTVPSGPARFVAIVQRQSRHLRRIVDDLLEASRMLRGKLDLERQPMDLAACVRMSVDSIATGEAAQGHRLLLDVEEVWIDGDSVRIEQIVSNLVGNALKFSPPGSTVDISVRALEASAVLEIHDAGSGVDPALLGRIFDPFFQAPPPAGTLSSGLGIGLALSRQLTELHSGTISVHSAGTGRGTTFTVRLPRIEAPAAGAVAKTVADPARGDSRLLLVEDNSDAREATAALLRDLGYIVAEAADGDSGLSAATHDPPALAILDLGLPGLSGLELAAAMKSDPALASIPLIALSGWGQEHDRAASLAAGFVEHLVKPVAPELLAAAIERHLQRQAAPAAPLAS